MSLSVTVTVTTEPGTLLAPAGLSMPGLVCQGVDAVGARATRRREPNTGQEVLALVPEAPEVTLRYRYSEGEATYPDALWRAAPGSRWTRAAEALVQEARAVAGDGPPAERATRLARDTAEKFTYGHPATRFYDGCDEIPPLACGLTEGSCVDINTYFLAALRAAGIEAGYVVGYFFPAEKGDHCEGMHCWVATRAGDEILHWDIAHHLKMGTRDVRPALNPKPGVRYPVGHGMGLDFPEDGVRDAKLLSEPVFARDGALHWPVAPRIRLHAAETAR